MALHSRTSYLALLSLAACSPDLSLLSDRASFAGASSGGEHPASAGASANGGSGGGDENAAAAGAAGQRTNGGEGGDASGDGGAAGAPPAPVPCMVTGAESCNAKDDDCDGVVDDGCPGGLTTTFEKDLQALGDSAGGVAFTDDCKDGEILGGITLAMGAFLSQASGVCRSLSLEQSPNAVNGYRVVLTDDRALAPHPASTTDGLTALACPENEALVGLRLAQQHYTLSDNSSVPVTSRVWLTCAKLVLVERDGKWGVTWEGQKELAPASGSIANGTAWLESVSAPAGLVASRLLGTSGSWIDRLGFGVSRVDVVLR